MLLCLGRRYYPPSQKDKRHQSTGRIAPKEDLQNGNFSKWNDNESELLEQSKR